MVLNGTDTYYTLLQRWCHETLGEVRPIKSLQMYDDHMPG